MNKNLCYIVGAGDFSKNFIPQPSAGDLLIAADGGYDYCRRLNLTPDIYIGDSDSLSDSFDIESIESVNKILLPTEKDDTDTLAAVKTALSKGFQRFYIYGGTGGRFSHTIANLQVLTYLADNDSRGFLFGKDCICTVIKNDTISYPSNCQGYISVFSLSDSAKEVTIKGLKYETDTINLTNTFPLGISNEFIGKKAEISVATGFLLIICNYLPEE